MLWVCTCTGAPRAPTGNNSADWHTARLQTSKTLSRPVMVAWMHEDVMCEGGWQTVNSKWRTPVVKTGPLSTWKIQQAWVLAPPWKVANSKDATFTSAQVKGSWWTDYLPCGAYVTVSRAPETYVLVSVIVLYKNSCLTRNLFDFCIIFASHIFWKVIFACGAFCLIMQNRVCDISFHCVIYFTDALMSKWIEFNSQVGYLWVCWEEGREVYGNYWTREVGTMKSGGAQCDWMHWTWTKETCRASYICFSSSRRRCHAVIPGMLGCMLWAGRETAPDGADKYLHWHTCHGY